MEAIASPAFPARIGRRFSLVLVAIVLAVLVVGGISVLLARNILHGYEIAIREGRHFVVLDDIEGLFHRILLKLTLESGTEDDDRRSEIVALQEALQRSLREFEALHGEGRAEHVLEPSGVSALGKLRQAQAALTAERERLLTRRRPPVSPDLDRLHRIADRVHQAGAELEKAHRELTTRQLEQARAGIYLITALYLGSLLVGGLLVAAARLVVHRHAVAPLRRLAGAAEAFARGSLDPRVPVDSRDEIGQVSHAFNMMADRLQAREREIRLAQAELEQRVRETRALYEIGLEVATRRELEATLAVITEKAQELLGTEVGCLCAKPDTAPVLRAKSGPAEAFPAFATSVCGEVAAAGEDLRIGCALQPAYQAAHLCVPLGRGEPPIGFLCVGSRSPRDFTAQERELLAGLATQAAIAVEKAGLYDEIRGLAAIQERERLAREMHDGLAQLLSVLHLRLQQSREAAGAGSPEMARALGEAIAVADQAYDEVRQAIFGLRTAPRMGLVATLREYLREFSLQAGIEVEITVGDETLRLPPASEVQLIRIVQEALANVRKHARAKHVRLLTERQNGSVRITIQDDGCGFNLSAAEGSAGHRFGLQTMQERAEGLGGSLRVESAIGRGTSVVAVLPLVR